jgi:hypothetical protein
MKGEKLKDVPCGCGSFQCRSITRETAVILVLIGAKLEQY